jgi:hypothetical protein
MTRMNRHLGLMVALLLLAPFSTANALGISIFSVSSTGGDTANLLPGDTITFDLLLTNPTNENVFGLGIVARGHDFDANGVEDDALSFSSGAVTDQILSLAFVPGSGGGLSGIDNIQSGPADRGFFNPVTFERQEKRVALFTGVSTVGSSADGSSDEGILGEFGGGIAGGDVHFQISFTAGFPDVLNKPFTLDFGNALEFGEGTVGAGGAPLSFTNVQHALVVVPEPGTAILMGLGLFGLAARRR